MRRKIRLSESSLHRIIKESVRRILREAYYDRDFYASTEPGEELPDGYLDPNGEPLWGVYDDPDLTDEENENEYSWDLSKPYDKEMEMDHDFRERNEYNRMMDMDNRRVRNRMMDAYLSGDDDTMEDIWNR